MARDGGKPVWIKSEESAAPAFAGGGCLQRQRDAREAPGAQDLGPAGAADWPLA